MADDPVDLALIAFRDLVATLDPTEATIPAIAAAYVYPYQEDSWRQQFEAEQLPVFIVEQMVGQEFGFDQMAAGRSSFKWDIRARLLIRRGRVNDTELAHEVAKVHNHYVTAFHDLLVQNYTIGGTVQGLGEGQGGVVFRGVIGHVGFLDQVYWGAVFRIPVRMTRQIAYNP